MKVIPLKLIAAALTLIPLAVELTRLYPVWRHSPLDKLDFIYPLAGLLLIAPLLSRHRRGAPDTRASRTLAAGAVAAAIAVLAAGALRSIHVVFFAGAVALPLSAAWLLFSRKLAWHLLPAGALILLGTPTSAVTILSPLFGDWALLKLATGAVIGVYTLGAEIFDFTPDCVTGCYFMALAALGFCSLFASDPVEPGQPWLLQTDTPRFHRLLGADQELNDADRRFFRGSRRVRRRNYYGRDHWERVLLLEQISGSSVHNVHPAEVCFASANWKVERKRQRRVELAGRFLAFQELIVRRPPWRMLVFVWYNDRELSTGSYLRFRRSWKPGAVWHIYQAAVPLADKNTGAAEKLLFDFLTGLRN